MAVEVLAGYGQGSNGADSYSGPLLVNASTGKAYGALPAGLNGQNCVWIEDGKMLFIDPGNRDARLVDIVAGTNVLDTAIRAILSTLALSFQHADAAQTVNGPVLALVAANGVTTLIDLTTRTLLPAPVGGPPTGTKCYFSPDGSKLAILSSATTQRFTVFETAAWNVIASNAANAAPRAGGWAADGSRFAFTQNVANGPNALAIFEATGWTRASAPAALAGSTPSGYDVAYSPDGALLALYQSDVSIGSNVRVYNTSGWSVAHGPYTMTDTNRADGLLFSSDYPRFFAYRKTYNTNTWADVSGTFNKDGAPLTMTIYNGFKKLRYTPVITDPFWTKFRNARETINTA
jgi:hypothetical protein